MMAERIVLVLGLRDKGVDVLGRADLGEHLEYRFVGAAVRRAPQGGDAGGNGGVGVCACRPGKPNGGRRGVLLVVRVQHEDAVHGAGDHGVDLVVLVLGECRVEEVLRVVQVIAGR